MAKNFIKNGTTADFVAVADVVSGDVVVLGGLMGVANADVLTGETGVAMIEGVFELPKVTGVAMSQGDFVGYDAASGKMIAEGGTGAAYVMADAGETAETVLVKINAGAGGGSEGGKMPIPEGGVTLTVGAGGDYATLGEAIEGAAVTYDSSFGGQVTINILAGTVLAEQIFLNDGADYSFIRVIGEDGATNVDQTALTVAGDPLHEEYTGGTLAFINVSGGTKSPNFNHAFVGINADGTGADDWKLTGVAVSGHGTVFNGHAQMIGSTETFGLSGFYASGLIGYKGCILKIDSATLGSQEGTYGDFFVSEQVTVYAYGVTMQNIGYELPVAPGFDNGNLYFL